LRANYGRVSTRAAFQASRTSHQPEEMTMSKISRSLMGLAVWLMAAPCFAQITFFEHDGFRGRSFSVDRAVLDFKNVHFNDTASSISVDRGEWEVCEDHAHRGRCQVLSGGDYPSLRDLGLNDRISSVRPLGGRYDRPDYSSGGRRDQSGYASGGRGYRDDYAYRRRDNERLYEAEVTSVRAVYGNDDRRCWQDGNQYRRDSKVAGAIVGGIIGGIIGHQIGSGSGRDAATVAGVAAGAAAGSRAARDDDRGYERGLRRCRDSGRGEPAFYDVSYEFRGREYWARLSYPPGYTIAVNRDGEPRD